MDDLKKAFNVINGCSLRYKSKGYLEETSSLTLQEADVAQGEETF